jgi:alpha-D-ribose 1-methylphosphonate 5-triphosphate synthase subunit PhnG
MKNDRRSERQEEAERMAAMATLAAAPAQVLAELWAAAELPEDAQPVRGPETGLVTIRGRIGGGGAPFNVGEATVTRATVKLPTGEIGHAYALGRDREKARLSAIADALWQDAKRRELVESRLLEPLRAMLADADRRRREETAATKVDFFTMVRGED